MFFTTLAKGGFQVNLHQFTQFPDLISLEIEYRDACVDLDRDAARRLAKALMTWADADQRAGAVAGKNRK